MKILEDMTILDAELSAKYDAELLKLLRKMDYFQQLEALEYIKEVVKNQQHDITRLN